MQKSTPIIEFVNANTTVSTINVNLSRHNDDIRISLNVVPATRVGRPLPDWPEALSLRGEMTTRKN